MQNERFGELIMSWECIWLNVPFGLASRKIYHQSAVPTTFT